MGWDAHLRKATPPQWNHGLPKVRIAGEKIGIGVINLEKFRIDNKLDNFEIGRVIAEHKERYIIKTDKGEFEAEITGNLRFSAKNSEGSTALDCAIKLGKSRQEIAAQLYIHGSVISAEKSKELVDIGVNIPACIQQQKENPTHSFSNG